MSDGEATSPRSELTAAIREGDAERVDALLDAEPELAETSDENGVPLLLTALYHRRPELAERIAARRGELTLHEAVALGRLEAAVEALEVGGADLEGRSSDGFTPLHYAAFFGREDLVAELLALGARVDAVADNPTRVQPLHSAAAIRSIAICRRLLDAGADPDARQQGGFTPLMSAALHGVDELVELLLERGADLSLTADDGKTARDFAVQGEHEQLAERLTPS